MERIVLSISVLVSNRKDTIGKCLESLRPLMKAIPSELIAIDTGSTDGSIDIVAEYTDKIYPFVWCKDFAAARNEGVKYATGEWFMFIDDDEWFEDISEIVEFFAAGEYKKYGTANYKVRNYQTLAGDTYIDSYASRMSRRTKEFHFEGRVHEHFAPGYAPTKMFEAYAHHYGYAFKDKEAAKEHTKRNMELLVADMRDKPQSLRTSNQLVQELLLIEDYEEADHVCRQVIDAFKPDCKIPEVQYMITMRARLLNNQHKYLEVIKNIEEAAKTHALIERSKVVFNVEGIVAAYNEKEYEQAVTYGENYLKLIRLYEKKRDVFMVQLRMDDIGYLSDNMQTKVAVLSANSALNIKAYKIAEKFFEAVRWNDRAFANDALQLILRWLATSDSIEGLAVISEEIIKSTWLTDTYLILLDAFLKEHKELRNTILCELARKKLPEMFFALKRIEYYLLKEDSSALDSELSECLSVAGEKHEALIMSMLITNSYGLSFAIRYGDMEAFRTGLIKSLETQSTDKMLDIICSNESKFKGNREFFLMAKQLLLERKLLKENKEFIHDNIADTYTVAEKEYEYDELKQLADSYAEAGAEYAKLMYKDNILNMPASCRFSILYNESEEQLKNGDIKESFKTKSRAAQTYLPMLQIIQKLNEAYSKKLEEDKKKEKGSKVVTNIELKLLASQLKKNIAILLKNGHFSGALELVMALKEYVPEDREVDELLQKCEDGMKSKGEK